MAKSLEFTNLPLVEVALKRVLGTEIPVELPFIISLVKELGDNFDQVRDLGFMEMVPIQSLSLRGQATNGCELVNSSNGVSVKLQSNLIVVRWNGSGSPNYPRFELLQKTADKVTTAISKITMTPPEVCLVNLTYANKLTVTSENDQIILKPWPISEEWTPKAAKETENIMELQTVIRSGNGVDLRFALQAKQESPEADPWYLLLTVAGKEKPAGGKSNDVENEVHSSLIDWFPKLLSKEAKIAYGLKS